MVSEEWKQKAESRKQSPVNAREVSEVACRFFSTSKYSKGGYNGEGV